MSLLRTIRRATARQAATIDILVHAKILPKTERVSVALAGNSRRREVSKLRAVQLRAANGVVAGLIRAVGGVPNGSRPDEYHSRIHDRGTTISLPSYITEIGGKWAGKRAFPNINCSTFHPGESHIPPRSRHQRIVARAKARAVVAAEVAQ